ncbi:MAG: Ig-like domain-containing protein, partial [Ruminiclostridium sp.]|nr:Ig-like domain-containing protein [Ruminiclostridium sp.]
MKKERLSDEIGKIDEDLIAEADKVRQEQHAVPKKKPIFIAASVVTAAAVLAGVVFIPKLTAVPGVAPDMTEVTTALTTPPAATTTGSVSDEVKLITSGRVKPKSSIISNISAIASEEDIHSGVGKLKLKESLVSSDAEFRITPADSSVDEDIIRKSIRISPDTDYTIKRDSDGSFLLKTNTLFARGSLIKLEVLDDNGDVENSWAFRTADDFRVSSVFPANESQFNPVDTGIELTFTALPDPSCVNDYFSVFPPTEGKLMTKGNSLYFVPDDQLKSKTKYTVILKKGFRSLDGEELAEDKTFRFYTSEFGNGGSYLYTRSSSSGFSETFLPGDQACVEIACSDDLRESEFDLHLYRFGDTGEYRAALAAKAAGEWSDGYVTDTSGLTEVFTSHEKPYIIPDTSGQMYDPYGTAYVMLPDNLETGCYIADISAGGGEYTIQYLIQICPLSVYSLGLGEENLFFVNDPETGKPASGAAVKLTAGGNAAGSGVVDTNGIGYVKADTSDVNALISVNYGTVEYNDAIILSGAEDVRFRDQYYMYLYTDRSTYLTSDTINVWGVVIPRSRDISVPENMKLCLGSEEKTVVPGKDGTFTAKFSIRDHIAEWTQTGLYSGEEL